MPRPAFLMVSFISLIEGGGAGAAGGAGVGAAAGAGAGAAADARGSKHKTSIKTKTFIRKL